MQRYLPGDGWVLGQRVWYHSEAGRWQQALSVGRACGVVEPWWCASLQGFALHGLQRYPEAELAFERSLRSMDAERAQEWRIPRRAVDRDSRRILDDLQRAPSDSVDAVLSRLWMLSDPLFLVDGNDRKTAHYARWTVSTIREQARNPFHIRWGDDIEQLTVRFGWEMPLPFFVYRGDFLRVGDKGIVRGRFWETDRIEFDVSLNGSFPTKSDDNNARDGMDDLDYLFEIGPRLQITLAKAPKWAKIDLELPVRAVFSTDLSSVEYQGVVFHPKLAYERENLLGPDSRLKVGIGPIIANSDLQEYFYEVKPKFARPGRPAFEADAGYLGTELQISLYTPITEQFRLVSVVRGANWVYGHKELL